MADTDIDAPARRTRRRRRLLWIATPLLVVLLVGGFATWFLFFRDDAPSAVDIDTATALSQILPVILLALMVELRRTKIHRRGHNQRRTRALMGAFFIVFALIETVLVLSIDGRVFPFQLSDLFAALIIFALLLMLFVLTFLPEFEEDRRRRHHESDAGGTETADDDGL